VLIARLASVLLLVLTAGFPLYGGPAVTLTAVGDVQLGRGVARAMARHGVDYPLAKVNDRLRRADLALFNLECALSQDGTPIAKRYSFKGDPAAANGLARAGLDVAVLANNHSVDCGRDRLAETIEALRRHGIAAVGAGEDAATAAAPLIVMRNGLRIAILARSFVLPDRVVYREDAPTVAMYDPETMLEEVRAARRQADVVIVSLHWGIEYAREPQESQRRIAHALVDAGAALVIGHHPHTPQPVERYRNGLIAYSLGNFVFDPAGEKGRHGLLLTCTLTRAGVQSYAVTPVKITNTQPRPQRTGAARSQKRSANPARTASSLSPG
jgi:poly-gamma-glutamate capsule biosynthesis protein CapA/YwtB (metallophosphatase superfamily)